MSHGMCLKMHLFAFRFYLKLFFVHCLVLLCLSAASSMVTSLWHYSICVHVSVWAFPAPLAYWTICAFPLRLLQIHILLRSVRGVSTHNAENANTYALQILKLVI